MATVLQKPFVKRPVGWLSALELLTNPRFDADSGWNKGAGCTIGSGVATWDGSQVATSNLFQANSITQYKTYFIKADLLTVTAGSLHWASGNTTGTDRTADGHYEETVYQDQVTGGNAIFAADSDFEGSIDNTSVREAYG